MPLKTRSKVIPLSSDAPAKDEKIPENKPDVFSADAASSSHKVATHPPITTMVKDALKELDTKKGTSTQAIRKYIIEKYPSVDTVRLKSMLRKALVKGMESGELVRPGNSQMSKGAQGSFRLARKNAKELKLKAAENTDPNVPKPTKAGTKKPKGTESDAGAVKKKASVRKQKDKSSEDSKPTNKANADKGAAASKVAPAKKPKAKKVVVGGGGEEASDAVKVPTSKLAKGKKVLESNTAKGSKK